MFIARQGDVMIMQVKAMPEKVKPVDRDNGRVVLAYGEVTGHAHAFHSPKVTMFRDDGSGGTNYLKVEGPEEAELSHEEHDTIKVPPGEYRVIRQREYTEEDAMRERMVAD